MERSKNMRWMHRIVGALMACAMLPYGAAQAQNPPENLSFHQQNSSCLILARLGLSVSEFQGECLEEELWAGKEGAISSASETQNAEARTLALLHQIPLAARHDLFKELAQGKEWSEISAEILAQIPLALAVSLSQESSLNVACSLPIATMDMGEGFQEASASESLPLPLGDAEGAHAMPAVSPAMAGAWGLPKPCKGLLLAGTDAKIAHPAEQTPLRQTQHKKVFSVYYFETMMPTGPPAVQTAMNPRRKMISLRRIKLAQKGAHENIHA